MLRPARNEDVSTLLEILAATAYRLKNAVYMKYVSTLLEILAKNKNGVTPLTSIALFQPFLRF